MGGGKGEAWGTIILTIHEPRFPLPLLRTFDKKYLKADFRRCCIVIGRMVGDPGDVRDEK